MVENYVISVSMNVYLLYVYVCVHLYVSMCVDITN